jgi:hypothetical protein
MRNDDFGEWPAKDDPNAPTWGEMLSVLAATPALWLCLAGLVLVLLGYQFGFGIGGSPTGRIWARIFGAALVATTIRELMVFRDPKWRRKRQARRYPHSWPFRRWATIVLSVALCAYLILG